MGWLERGSRRTTFEAPQDVINCCFDDIITIIIIIIIMISSSSSSSVIIIMIIIEQGNRRTTFEAPQDGASVAWRRTSIAIPSQSLGGTTCLTLLV